MDKDNEMVIDKLHQKVFYHRTVDCISAVRHRKATLFANCESDDDQVLRIKCVFSPSIAIHWFTDI
jgi:hypothetical protein